MRIRSFIAWWSSEGEAATAPRRQPNAREQWKEWRRGQMTVRYLARAMAPVASVDSDALPELVLGDDSEFNAGGNVEHGASGAPIRYDEATNELVARTSIVALPPIFLYRGGRTTAIASDIHLLVDVLGARLELEPRGVTELGHFGHPVDHRTLYRGVEIVAGGSRLRLGRRGAAVERVWRLPARAPLAWPEFLEAQIDAFTRHVQAIDVSQSFLSLTAGLDTRTVFAALAQQHRLITAATMTGVRRSLDARIAGRLCRAYGIQHDAITFDDQFVRTLPAFVEQASRLSGGLASLDQAPEVYLYDQLGGRFAARLSGNLGNQVGRGGTEGVSVRAARLDILAPRLRHAPPGDHWLLAHLDQDETTTLEFILQREIPFTLVSNFCVGNHFAAQQSPYASHALIATLARRPADRAGAPSGSRLRMRLRDLRHRFLGEPESHSFQRTLVRRIGGFVADCPVNWGWRPSGGVSPAGLALGAATLAGMFARAKGLDGGLLRKPLAWSGLPALHDFREARRWLRNELHDFTLDTLGSSAIRDADLFDEGVLRATLDDHFQGRRDHYHTVTFALDLALAHRTFCQ
ncbi:MAG: hypothetical protein ACRENU_00840 [Gemmatimonadaceae bacterium]